MRKIFYELDIGFCGCGETGVTEVHDHVTDREIDDMVHGMALEHASSWEGDESLGFEAEYGTPESEEEIDNFYANVSGSWEDYDADKHEELY